MPDMRMMMSTYPIKAKLLTDKGVLVGLENSGSHERMNTETHHFSWYMCRLRSRQRTSFATNHF
jgi:hypothetical protein